MRLPAFAGLCLLTLPAVGQTPSTFTQLVVFGDSLSDNGNFFAQTGQPAAPYWRGRSSNGPVWVEQMANQLGLEGLAIDDNAVAFATTQDVRDLQLLPWLGAGGGSVDPRALHVYWAGANDLFDLLANPGGDPTAVIGAAMQNTVDSLLALLAAGAQHVMIVNLPDLSATPFVVELGDPATTAAVLALTAAYNGALGQAVAGLEGATGFDFVEVDAFTLTRGLVADPLSGGFQVVDQRALAPDGTVARDPDAYLFWDHVHPTSRGHSFVMNAALLELGLLWGDVDLDGDLDLRDVAALEASLGPCGPGTTADLDGNARVDGEDVELLRILLHSAGVTG